MLWWYDPSSGSFGVASVGLTWIAIFYALLVLIVLAGSEGWIARVMRIGWLRNVGRVSYCMYIIHLVVDSFCHTILLHTRPRIVTLAGAGAGVSVLAAIVTYGLAVVSRKLFEGPLVRIGHGFVYSAPAGGQARAGSA